MNISIITAFCLVGLTSLQTNLEAGEIGHNHPRSKKLTYIYAHCGVPQGNGGDWASTIAWMAEELMIKSELSKAKEATLAKGEQVGVDLACMLGGSSGSAATMLLMKLLENERLGVIPIEYGIYDSISTAILSRALRVIAYSLDLTFSEQVLVISHILTISMIVFPMQVIKAAFPCHNEAKKITFNLMRGNFALSFFARDLLLAKHIPISYVNMDLRRILPDADRKLLQKMGMFKLSDMAVFKGPKVPDQSSFQDKKWEKIHRRISKKIVKKTRRLLKYHLGKRSSWEAINRDAKKETRMLDLLNEPPTNGFCTITMSILRRKNPHGNAKAMLYQDMRPLVLCNKKTIETILHSEQYCNDILQKAKFPYRFILGVVKSTRGAISPSIREPLLMEPLAGPLDQDELEIAEIYDPQTDSDINGINRFLLMPAKGLHRPNLDIEFDLEVIGGFADRRISAWMLSYYHLAKDLEFRRREIEVEGTFALFGIPDERVMEKFDTYLIKNRLCEDPDDQETTTRNLDDWLEFQADFFRHFSSQFERRQRTVSTVAFNYDLTKVPASLARKGWYLVGKAANATRQQLHASNPEIKNNFWYYDPSPNRGVIHIKSNPRLNASH